MIHLQPDKTLRRPSSSLFHEQTHNSMRDGEVSEKQKEIIEKHQARKR
jgi:hypothetical protein